MISVTDGSDQVVTLADTISIASSTASIGRYWRVLVLANNGDQYTSICKLRFLDVAGNSLTSPADADARASADSTANTQNPAANAFGTDLGKKWTAQPVAPPHWLQWDFGVSTPVYGIEIVGQYSGGDLADAAVRDFVLQVSDDAQRWTDVISVKGQTGWGAAEARRFNAARPALTPYEQAVLSQSPLVFIPCNDPEGSVASDISGYERHGAYPANAQLAAPSLFAGGARSVRLPGGALTIPYGAWQDLTGDFTLIIGASIAAPGADTGNYPKLIAKFVAASNGLATYLLQAQKSDGHLVGRVSTPSTSYNDVSTAVSVMDAQARLIVLRRAGNDLSLLVDNVKVSSVAVSGPVSVAPNGIQIGGSGTTDGIDASVMWFSLHAAALSDRVLTGLAQLTAPPQTGHRYWRVMVEATAGANVSLAQVEFLGARNAPIVALGGTPTASAALSGYGADKAFDGSGSGKWASGKSAPQWVQYDFGEGVKPDVQGVAITAPREGGADEAPAALRVQWSDDGDQWTDLVSTSGIASWSLGERRAFCKDGHRYWRLYVTKIGNMGQRYFALGAAGLLLQAGEAEDAAMTRGDKPYAASNPLQGASYVWHDTSGVGSNAFTFADGGMSTTGPWWLSVDLLAGTRFVPAELWLYAQPHTPDNTDRAPVDFVVQWSDDNQAWTDYKPFSGVSLPWTVGTAYRFSTTL
nr:discoidin domain-containing protein [Luteibacter sp.]